MRLVSETRKREGQSLGVVTRIARQLGIGPEWLRQWRQAEVDGGVRPGTTTDEQRIAELERENREVWRRS